MSEVSHEGHRGRVRDRFRKEGLDGFAEHEVLELLLFYGRARGDTNALAHNLLDAFGSLKGVLEASTEQLMTVRGVGEETATLVSLMLPMFRRYQACVNAARTRIATRKDAEEYCRTLLAGYRSERFYVICVSSANVLLGRRLVAEGSLTEVSAYPRTVVETALNYNAAGVILCHNHPGGSAAPSKADIQVTERLAGVLRALDIVLLDHIIVSGAETFSMAQNGLLRVPSGRKNDA